MQGNVASDGTEQTQVPASERDSGRVAVRVIVGSVAALAFAWDLLVGAVTSDPLYVLVAGAGVAIAVLYTVGVDWARPALGTALIIAAAATAFIERFGLLTLLVLLVLGLMYAGDGTRRTRAQV